jgi:hypothetical protein
MENKNYQVKNEFHFTVKDEIIKIPYDTVLHSNLSMRPGILIAIHYEFKEDILIPISFVEKNPVYFVEISKDEAEGAFDLVTVVRILKDSKIDRDTMIRDLSKALKFVAIKDEDLENIDYSLLEDIEQSLLEDGIKIGQAPVTRWTWNSSDSKIIK